MTRVARHSGFTLLELVLVMVIILVVMGMAAPQLRSWGRGSKIRDCADDFVSTTKWARVQSAAKGTICRVNVAADSFSVSYQSGQQFVEDENRLSHPVLVPSGAHLEVNGGGQPVNAIYFYPTGRVDPVPVSVRVVGDDGSVLDIACQTASDDFAVITGQDGAR